MIPHTPFSALYRPPLDSASASRATPTDSPLPLARHWIPEQDPSYPTSDPSLHFNVPTGEYHIPTDGIYSLIVQLIPINGRALLSNSSSRRIAVHYTLKLTVPDHDADDDDVHATYMDIGSVNFGQMTHLKKGTRLSCLKMPGAEHGAHCVRLKIELLQRKLKKFTPQLTRKQIKKKRKQKRKASVQHKQSLTAALTEHHQLQQQGDTNTTPATMVQLNHGHMMLSSTTNPSFHVRTDNSGNYIANSSDMHNNLIAGSSTKRAVPQQVPSNSTGDNANSDEDDSDDDDDESDSDWAAGFESDSTDDELPHSSRNINRLAKRFKSSTDSRLVFHH